MKLSPTSFLPTEPAAKKQALNDMWESQQIDRATFLRLLDDPDLQSELDLETADKMVVDEMLERMLDAEEEDGEAAYMPPLSTSRSGPRTTPAGRSLAGRLVARSRPTTARCSTARPSSTSTSATLREGVRRHHREGERRANGPVNQPTAGPANVNGVPDVGAPPMPAPAPAMPGATPPVMAA